MNNRGSIEKIKVERNLQSRVYESIKNYVIHPSTPPGTRLYEEELSKEIGVSRTPVRIALNRLEHEGLVKINPNKGTFKVHLSLKEVSEVIRIRGTLECLSLEMADGIDKELIRDLANLIPSLRLFKNTKDRARYPEFDQQFHELLVRAGKSEWLFRMIRIQDNVFHMFRLIALQNIERIKFSIQEHERIVKALKMNDIPLAIQYTKENYKSAVETMEQKSREVPGLFL